MNLKTETKLKTTNSKIFYCNRCEIDSLGSRMCPCPRGGCDAKVVGLKTVKTKTIIYINASKDKKIT